jgi:hypothetical protein
MKCWEEDCASQILYTETTTTHVITVKYTSMPLTIPAARGEADVCSSGTRSAFDNSVAPPAMTVFPVGLALLSKTAPPPETTALSAETMSWTGTGVGKGEGAPDGSTEGTVEGDTDGVTEGLPEAEGNTEGMAEGEIDGATEGNAENTAEGVVVGAIEGETEGMTEGNSEGLAV